MILKDIKLYNFRNFSGADIQWNPGVNIIRGANAQGKTNILESIAFLSTLRSFRKSSFNEMIRKDTDFFLIKSNFQTITGDNSLNIAYSPKKKIRIKADDVLKKSGSQVIGKLNTVVFSPDDLSLIKGGPEERRHFLDNEIIQTEPEMNTVFSNYQKALKQRNYILKIPHFNQQNKSLIEVYNQQLAENGSLILYKRKNMLRKLQPLIRLAHRHITDGKEELSIDYKGCFSLDNKDNLCVDEWNSFIKKQLSDSFSKDRECGFTTFGPHREDLIFNINGDNLRHFGSQGQQRTAVLALKIGELELMKSHRGEYPILLLDDVLSELDEKRREALVSVINGRIQTFITDTGSNLNFQDAFEYKIINGKIYNI